MTQDVVVGVDGSEISLGALEWAAAVAKVRGLGLHIVCAYRLPSYIASGRAGTVVIDEATVREGAQAVVEDAAARVAHHGVPVRTTVDPGDPSGVLIELSKGARAVVCGTRGGGGFTDRLLGAVPSAVPAHAHSPAVVVPSARDEPFVPIRRIAVGVDGSPAARLAVTVALNLAESFGAEVHAVAAVPLTAGASAMAWLPSTVDHEEILADVRMSIDEVVDPLLDGRDITVHRRAVDGNPGVVLAEISEQVDLLAVGSRGRGGLAGLVLGSTSQGVLSHATCPVIVTPARVTDAGLTADAT
ncbi:universal stress protein [Georgenia sp. Z1491]|uniref:universal stress protein n=1 Tax=Georgenia sp. Z1491 TaxID=3416707 RepID=UPI003CF2C509